MSEAVQTEFAQIMHLFISYHSVYKFLIPKNNMLVLVTFCMCNDITGGWGNMGGLNIGVQNGARR